MPSLFIPSTLLPHISMLPGRALIRVSPAEQTTASGLLHLPERAAEREAQSQSARMGEIVAVNADPHPNPKLRVCLDPGDLVAGMRVLYLGHLDEMDNEYVVVLHGQIIAVVGVAGTVEE